MIIRKIRLKNINSLKGEHVIDFTSAPFANNILFAITGPTGSGKTTILDAICLALYNRIPRLKSNISKNLIIDTGVILSQYAKEGFSEVEFSCANGIFSSRWEISTNRNGVLRDHEMRLYNDTGIVIEEKKTAVPERIEKLIGLNYDQFTKSIMLPQGDFALFLKSSKHERGKLLEKITGSSIYRELGQKAFQKSKEIEKNIETITARISTLVSKKIDNDEFVDIKNRCALIEKEQAELQNKIINIKQQIEIKQNISRLKNETLIAENNLNKKENELKEFNDINGNRFYEYKKLIPIVDNINEIINIDSKIDTNRLKLNELEKQLAVNGENYEDVSEKIAELVKSVDVLAESPLENLNQLENKVKELISKLEQKEVEYRAEFKTIKELSNDFGVELLSREEPQAISDKISDRKKNIIASMSELENNYPNICSDSNIENIARMSNILDKISEWEKKNIAIKHIESNIEETQKKYDHIKKEISDKQQLIRILENKLIKTTTEHASKERELKELRSDEKYEDERRHLVNGKPCPVCGSTEHPWRNKIKTENNQLEKEVEELEKEKIKTKSQLDLEGGKNEQNLSNLETLEVEINRLQNNIKPLNEQASLLKSEQYVITKQDSPSEATNYIKKQIIDYQAYNNLKTQLEKIEKTRVLISELIQIYVDAKSIKQSKEEIYKGTDITKDSSLLRNRYIDITNEKLRISKLKLEHLNEMETNNKMKEQRVSEILPELEKLGYSSFNEVIKYIIPTKEYNNLNNQLQELNQSISTLKGIFETINNQLQNAIKQDIMPTESELQKSLSLLSENNTSMAENRDILKEKIITQQNIRSELSECEKEIDKIKKIGEKWILLDKVIGDATGNKFNNIAQSLTLNHLISKANKCIIELNPRYRLDINDFNDDDALSVIDLDLGHQKRSVRTLSGGETFLVSLSLALGLADMVSNNVTIGSLFIDEGFGTLDPETLDLALAMLESLQAKGNKSIGIISHVETLKERISARIDLVPVAGQGYSKIVLTS